MLQKELQELGCREVHPSGTGAYFEGTLEDAYRIILWSRLANRILFPLIQSEVDGADQLYELSKSIEWESHFRPDTAFVIDVVASDRGSKKSKLSHTQYAAQRVKDGIVDRLREKTGQRPSVDRHSPDLRIHVAIMNRGVQFSIDLGGGSLHMRGYRMASGSASLKENLAAGIIRRSGWDPSSHNFCVDPLCGTGTLLLEAACVSYDIAPGLLRNDTGMRGWAQFPADNWDSLCQDARAKRIPCGSSVRFFGYDCDPSELELAEESASELGLSEVMRFTEKDLFEWGETEKKQFQHHAPSLLVCNPPYGERLGSLPVLNKLYRQLGTLLRSTFPNWNASVFSSNEGLSHRLSLRAHTKSPFKNGPLDCNLFQFEVPEISELPANKQRSEAETMFFNRLAKNKKKLSKWLKKDKITCYRHYDADMPEYNAAIDVYEDQVICYEYAPPKTIDPAKAEKRRFEMLNVLPDFFEIPASQVYLKTRKRQRGNQQYERQAGREERTIIHESGLSFFVNLRDYLDTGIFLDHRPVRKLIRDSSMSVDFLNLFAYTGTASVYSVAGGARSTTTVDLSNKYLDWAEENMDLNHFHGRDHHFIQSDVFEFLKEDRNMYDLIFLDPPSFSNSKKFKGSFDIERDHAVLISYAMARLRTGGTLIFSCNLRTFKLNTDELQKRKFFWKDISRDTIPPDFSRRKNIHSTFIISWKPFEKK